MKNILSVICFPIMCMMLVFSACEYHEEGQIVWDMDMEVQSLDITIEEVEKIENLPYPGSYQFELVEHSCNYDDNQYLSVEGREYGLMITDYVDNDSLIITNACVDGHIILFVR